MRLDRSTLVVAALAGAVGLAGGVALGRTSYPPLEVLLQRGASVLDQPLAYPTGAPAVTAAIVTLQPGQATGPHHHEVPLLGYVLEGAITVDYGDAGSRTFGPGEAFIEAFRTVHEGRNAGDVPMRLLAVYMGAEDAANTVMD